MTVLSTRGYARWNISLIACWSNPLTRQQHRKLSLTRSNLLRDGTVSELQEPAVTLLEIAATGGIAARVSKSIEVRGASDGSSTLQRRMNGASPESPKPVEVESPLWNWGHLPSAQPPVRQVEVSAIHLATSQVPAKTGCLQHLQNPTRCDGVPFQPIKIRSMSFD